MYKIINAQELINILLSRLGYDGLKEGQTEEIISMLRSNDSVVDIVTALLNMTRRIDLVIPAVCPAVISRLDHIIQEMNISIIRYKMLRISEAGSLVRFMKANSQAFIEGHDFQIWVKQD